MIKKLIPLLISLSFFSNVAYAQRTLVPGVSVNSFTASALTNVAGTPYQVPGGFSPTISWTITYATTPSAVSVSLQGSQDNISWFTLDTTTNTAGDLRYFNPIALNFIRAFITSRTGGSTITVSILINRGFNNVMSGGTLTTGAIIPVLCTAGNGFGFAGDSDTKICSDTADNIKFYAGGVNSVTIDSSGLIVGVASFTLGATDTLAWTGRAKITSPADSILRLTNDAVTAFDRLQFGGGTSSFPSLKRNGTAIDFRLADDSGYAPINGGLATFNATVTVSGMTNAAAGAYNWSARSAITSPVNSSILFTNAAGTDFSQLQFGGTSAAFPSLKRSLTNLQVRLADDSAYAPLTAESLNLNDSAYLSSSGLGLIRLHNNAGSFSRLQFGGTTSAYPSLKRVSNGLQVKLADDSAYTSLQTGDFYAGVDNSFSIGLNGSLRFGDIYLANSVQIQSGLSTGGLIVGGDFNGATISDSIEKRAYVSIPHYLTSEEPVALVQGDNLAAESYVNIGGGLANHNAVTSVRFYTAANNTTLAGTNRWNISSAGNLESAGNNLYDIGASASLRPRTVYAATSVVTPLTNSTANYQLNGVTFQSATAPTIASGGCTSPAVTWNNGTALFLVTIGTSCTGVKTFTLTMPAAAHFWGCSGDNNTSDAAQQTNYIIARGTSTTAVVVTSYDRVTGVQEDFTASDTYLIKCIGG